MIGKPDSIVITGTMASNRAHNLPHEVLSAADIRRRYPVFNVKDDDIGIFEVDAGYLVPENCIQVFIYFYVYIHA